MKSTVALLSGLLLSWVNSASAQQRVWGVDVSYWNRGTCSAGSDGISQTAWNSAHNTPDANGFTRQFVYIRATRGGTAGVDQPSGTPGCVTLTNSTFSERYDDPEFLRLLPAPLLRGCSPDRITSAGRTTPEIQPRTKPITSLNMPARICGPVT